MTSMDISIADRFEAVAQAQPEKSAVNAGDSRQATESWRRMRRESHTTCWKPGWSGVTASLYFGAQHSAVAAWLGVLRAGAVVVPLVPVHPLSTCVVWSETRRPGSC